MDYFSAIETNLFQFYEFAAARASLELIKERDFSWVSNRKSAWPNWIFRINRDLLTDEDFIRNLTDRIKNREIPPFLVTREPDHPEKFYALAHRFGMKQINRWTGMAVTPEDYFSAPGIKSKPPIIEVRDPDTLTDWIQVVNSSLFNSTTMQREIVEKLYCTGPLTLFLGYENKSPVATSLSFEEDSIAGLYMVATVEKHRGQGLGTALTRFAMDHCFLNRNRLIILHASAMGESIYRKIGFREYCRFGILWMVGRSFR